MRGRFRVPTSRTLSTWILLLACAQLADVVTTWVDMSHGGVEANAVVGTILAHGGLGLVAALKLALVLAMGISCQALNRYASDHPTFQARAAHAFVWRATQLSVLGLVVVALHNTALLAQIA
jgi:hypothetical protein